MGLDLHLPDADPEKVYGHADRLIGQLPAPETAPATRDTVQIDIAETLPAGTQTFGLVKVRSKVVWQDGPRHVLRIHRQMPIGWPEGDHHEADESALTGRTDPVRPGAVLHFGIPPVDRIPNTCHPRQRQQARRDVGLDAPAGERLMRRRIYAVSVGAVVAVVA